MYTYPNINTKMIVFYFEKILRWDNKYERNEKCTESASVVRHFLYNCY